MTNENNVPVLKTETMENRIDKFLKSIDSVEALAEKETLSAIENLLQMGTIKDWGRLVKMVFAEMKGQLQNRIEKASEVRGIVNR